MDDLGLREGAPRWRLMSLPERLAAQSIPEPNSGCLLWEGAINQGGYGRVRWNGKGRGAHRMAWQVSRGLIPEGLCVCHKCDVRSCINPDHLFLGTHRDNVIDMWAKGRGSRNGLREEDHPKNRLSRAQVFVIKADTRTHRKIAEEYGVCSSTVTRIKTGQLWPHLWVKADG